MIVDAPRGEWIVTASGRQFFPLEPRAEDVALEDIAHHLSHLCRFSGAVRTFYSVAQHSVLASRELEVEGPRAALFGLLHDASEAYLMDVPRPLKHSAAFAPYRALEARLQDVIYGVFGLALADEPPVLKLVDRRLLRTEQRDLMPHVHLEDRGDVTEYPWSIRPHAPAVAARAFLVQFRALQLKLQEVA